MSVDDIAAAVSQDAAAVKRWELLSLQAMQNLHE